MIRESFSNNLLFVGATLDTNTIYGLFMNDVLTHQEQDLVYRVSWWTLNE